MLPLANVVQKAGGSIADVAKWSFLCLLNLLQFVQIKGQVSMLFPLKSSAPSGAGRGMCDTNTSLVCPYIQNGLECQSIDIEG